MTKIIANYLPQFHQTKENDMWWGKGYTDWVAVKKATPLFKGHIQPRIPSEGYYDLSQVEHIRRQVELANKYNIYGFAIYHYWFNNEQNLLTTPVEIIHDHEDLDINYMFIWDNGSWKRTWSAIKDVKYADDWAPMYSDKKAIDTSGILALLEYGEEEDWINHFSYLLKFFKDKRYIKIDNKPFFGIFHIDNEPEKLDKMLRCWNDLAIQNGFDGIATLSNINSSDIHITDYEYLYEPWAHTDYTTNIIRRGCKKIDRCTRKWFPRLKFYNYDSVWKSIIKSAKREKSQKVFPGAIVGFDDTPRRGREKGKVIKYASPQKFKKYLGELLQLCEIQQKNFVFLTAWNEWGEGAYLEPDTIHGMEYLEAVKEVMEAHKKTC